MRISAPSTRVLLQAALILVLSFFLVLSGIYLYLAPKLPSVEQLKETKLQVPLRVYSRNLKLIGEYGEKRRIPLGFESIPPLFIKAVLAAEDDRFYQHGGVDVSGLLRAASELALTGRIKSGGSTITMQVARNFFLSNDQTFARKFNEILLALQIERELSKDEILELYINKIYLGNRAYGLGAAAQIYYGVTAADLSLAQQAMIAGLPKWPSTKNPLSNPEAALNRRNWILGRMLKLQYLEQEQYDEAHLEEVSASHHELTTEYHAPYVAEMARQFSVQKFGKAAYTEGYQVVTTINEDLQQVAQHALQTAVLQYDKRHGYRGPEQHIDLPENLVSNKSENDNKSDKDNSSQEGFISPQEYYSNFLKKTPAVAMQQAAVVVKVDDKTITLLTPNNDNPPDRDTLNDANNIDKDLDDRRKLPRLTWKGISEVFDKIHVSENQSKPLPENLSDIFSVGDVIRVIQKVNTDTQKTSWQISQIPKVQAALVSLDPENGSIISLVGGFDFKHSKYNRATQANRQVGSNFKPFFYTSAIEQGFTPATLINDSPIVFSDNNLENTWRPENSGGKFLGPIRLRKALYLSRNLVSIRLLQSLGVKKAIASAIRFGFKAESLPKDLSLALGSLSVPPITIATGYGTFANGGYKIEPYLIETITDINSQAVYRADPLTVCRDDCKAEILAAEKTFTKIENNSDTIIDETTDKTTDKTATNTPYENLLPLPIRIAPRIVDEQTAYLMDSMLKDVIKRGTGRRARALRREDIGGKTGTTNGPTDVWFSGYSPHLATTTWLGFDSNRKLGRREYGGTAALPMWIEYMQAALKGLPDVTRPQPNNMVRVRIDEKTGLRASPRQENTLFEVFRSEYAPTEHAKIQGDDPLESTHEILPDEMF